MTKVTLRSYNREIEALTDQGKIDLAIAHCIHILKYFPKHVDTYRLLGKAYLENQRLGDAADIFQRVLSAIPDDFVSHIGMSIIREDEGNLDASIWHMQRAYDVQSSNITIQDELRRLYDKRDGIEPPKIRLTRAALARMYARGDLINEAITELRSALQEEPDRADLLALLARMYFTNNQRVKSIQTCSQVLNKLPYCLDANIIISQALTDTNRAEEAGPYQEKARELDPYAAYISEHAPTINLVPDAAVTLLKLDENEVRSDEAQPAWVASLGVEMPGVEQKEEDIDWMLETSSFDKADQTAAMEDFDDETDFEASLATSAAFGAAISESKTDADDAPAGQDDFSFDEFEDTSAAEIPDWLQGAGWEPRDPNTQETAPEVVDFDDEEFDFEDQADFNTSDDTLVPADIPDWLKAMAPPESAEDTTPNNIQEEVSGETFDPETTRASMDVPDWLRDLEGDSDETVITGAGAPSGENVVPDWLQELDPGEDEPEEVEDTSAMPDWLQGLDSVDDAEDEAVATASDIPDWLTDLDGSDETAPAAAVDLPDWLSEMDEDDEAEPAEAMPDWLGELEDDDGPATEIEIPETVPAAEDTAPDWLDEQEEDGLATALEMPGDAAMGEEVSDAAVPDWLQDLDGEEDELSEDTPVESVDAWLSELADDEDDDSAESDLDAATEDHIDEDLPEWLKNMAKRAGESSTTSSERTGVTLWLRKNAESQEESPEPESETSPESEFVLDFDDTATMQTPRPAELEALKGLTAQGDADDEAGREVPAWLQGFDDALLSDETVAGEETAVDEEEAEELPAALEASAQAETPEPADLPDLDDTDAALRWLESLAAKQGAKEEELLTSPEERTDTPPEWVQTMAAAAAAEAAGLASEPVEMEDTAAADVVDDELDDLDWEELVSAGAETDETLPEAAAVAEDLGWLTDFDSVEDEDEGEGEITAVPGAETPAFAVPADEADIVDSPDWLLADQDEEPESAAGTELPAWLQEIEIDEPEAASDEDSDVPDWLQDIEIEEAETTVAVDKPDWVSETDVTTSEPASEAATDEEEDYVWEQETPEAETTETTERPNWWAKVTGPLNAAMAEVETEEEPQTVEPQPTTPAPQAPKSPPAARKAPVLATALADARSALAEGDVPRSLAHYRSLIKKKVDLDTIIEDLNKALQHSHPVNIDIWATLGDAYAKNNNLQKALDAYTKAEELIR